MAAITGACVEADACGAHDPYRAEGRHELIVRVLFGPGRLVARLASCRLAGEPILERLPFHRHELVGFTASRDVSAGREREVIALDQHPVGGGAVEHLLSRLHR